MLSRRVIVCLDVKGARVVKGVQFEGLRDVTDYPNITRALVARGWGEAALAKLWGGNTLRVMRAVAGKRA